MAPKQTNNCECFNGQAIASVNGKPLCTCKYEKDKLVITLKKQLKESKKDFATLVTMMEKMQEEIKRLQEQPRIKKIVEVVEEIIEIDDDDSFEAVKPDTILKDGDKYSDEPHQCNECGVCEPIILHDDAGEDDPIGSCQGCGSDVYEIEDPCEQCLAARKDDPFGQHPYVRCDECTKGNAYEHDCDQEGGSCDKCRGVGDELLKLYNQIHGIPDKSRVVCQSPFNNCINEGTQTVNTRRAYGTLKMCNGCFADYRGRTSCLNPTV